MSDYRLNFRYFWGLAMRAFSKGIVFSSLRFEVSGGLWQEGRKNVCVKRSFSNRMRLHCYRCEPLSRRSAGLLSRRVAV